jgi:hypothetical protein
MVVPKAGRLRIILFNESVKFAGPKLTSYQLQRGCLKASGTVKAGRDRGIPRGWRKIFFAAVDAIYLLLAFTVYIS